MFLRQSENQYLLINFVLFKLCCFLPYGFIYKQLDMFIGN